MGQEERVQVLRMVAEGKVSPEEGARLLEAVERRPAEAEPAPGRARWLRVRVEAEGGRQKVNVRLPVSLVQVALGIALRYLPRDGLTVQGQPLDPAEILKAIQAGVQGPVVEVRDEGDGTVVEVILE